MKMIRSLFLIYLMIISVFSVLAQELYMPIEYRQAYENGTRASNGTVSEKYFQNRSIYDIKVSVNPDKRLVEGNVQIRYFNNSTHTLKKIVFHSYKDVYWDGMVLKSVVLNDEQVDLKDKRQIRHYGTHYSVYLNEYLTPGDFVDLEIEWSITIPAKVNRDGAYDESSMFVAYWYPEIAVYDDVFGWDKIVFDGRSEFYHDFSDYKISIEIPKEYVVWASSAPINGDEIFPKKIKSRLKEVENSDEKVVIISEDDLEKPLKMKENIWKYEVKNFPDFSFAFSDHYLWESIKHKDQHGTYTLNSAYPEQNENFAMVADLEVEALEIFHSTFPKYPFPFEHFVAFNGETGGGMEFPGMCNNAVRKNASSEGKILTDIDANKLLTVHEMMHMYFPFLMGINEKRYGWLDEGMAEYAEDAFTGVDLESERSRERLARSGNPPPMVETYTIPKSYVVVSYDISSQAFYALRSLLGEQTFDRCLQEFMSRWEYKHPTPYDLFYTFNDVSGKNLNWFWKAWFFDWGYPDVGIVTFEDGVLALENLGSKPIALSIEVSFEDGKQRVMELSPEVWREDLVHQVQIESPDLVTKIVLKTLNGDDAIRDNNYWSK